MAGMARGWRTSRRAVLLAAIPLAGARAQVATLAPDGPALRWEGLPGQVTLPSSWAPRTMAMPAVGGKTVTAVAITDSAPDSTIEVLLLAGHDGRAPRILALEALQWQAPGASMNARPILDGSGKLLILDRGAALRRTPTLWRREAWRDFLAWDGTMLADRPVRPAPAGTMQAAMERIRAATLRWLATPRQAVTAQDLAGLQLDARGFSLG